MTQKLARSSIVLAAAVALTVPAAHAGIVIYDEDGKVVEFGGRIQIQYYSEDPDGGESSDDVFFRRLRPEFEAQINERWMGKVQLEVGEAEDENELKLKDAYARYMGWKNVTLTLGNVLPPYSRELKTTSKEQQLIERTFVGDHNYGVLDRFLAVLLDGEQADGKFQWALAGGWASVDPEATRLDLDTPVNRNGDFNDGLTLSGSLDFFPLGEVDFKQGDLDHGPTRWGFRISGYSWENDDDNNTYTDPTTGLSISETKADIDSATGLEASLALRSHGWSFDAQYNQIEGDTVDPTFTGGLYRAGSTTLDAYAIEGGYAFNDKVELVAGYDSLDADNYADAWTRTGFGLNWFFEKQKAKVQFTYLIGENVDGVPGADANETFVQFQYAW